MNRRRLLLFAALVPVAVTGAAHRLDGGASPPEATLWVGEDERWLKQVLDWQHGDDPNRFLDTLRFDPPVREIYVFTPKHDVVALPLESTPVDFAYTIHTTLGHSCVGAFVNGRPAPLTASLRNEVRIVKAVEKRPQREWLDSVKSARARAKIISRL